MRRCTAMVAIVLASTAAFAAPKGAKARTHFDAGVTAYGKQDFQAAAAAFAKSYAIEADEETLFAWAQTERKLDRCDKAIDLYNKLLAMDLPAENKEVIKTNLEECKAIVAAQTAPAPEPKKDPKQDPKPDPKQEPTPAPTPDEPARAFEEPASEPPRAVGDEGRAWWKDPLGGALVGAGVVGLAVGTVFLVQGSAADADKESATRYDDYVALADDAESKGRIGVIATVAGGALLVGGIIRYAMTSKRADDKVVSGWATSDSGGIVLGGRW